MLDSNEQCEDGNINSSDGRSSMCMVEPGYTCQGRPYSCAKPQGEEHPEAAPPAGDADTSSTLTDHDRCMLFGCVTGQWSSPTGCVIRL